MDGVTASAYTDVNKPVGVELAWPARNSAAEAYLFAFVSSKFHAEEDVLTHVRIGGYVQNAPKPLSAVAYQNLQEQFRTVKDKCLNCGLPGTTRCGNTAKPNVRKLLLCPLRQRSRWFYLHHHLQRRRRIHLLLRTCQDRLRQLP